VTISTNAITWAASRGIKEQTLQRMRVISGAALFGEGEEEAIVFQYFQAGERVNYKARSLAGKKYKQQKGGEQQFFNLDKVLDGPMDTVWITEGELDAISLVECGVCNDAETLSVPAGAPSEASDDPGSTRKYEYVLTALKQGLSATRYIIAVDDDNPGRALRSDLVAILGAARCWFVDWPEDVKDANEALMAWGADDLRVYLQDAQSEWPVQGLYRLSDIPEPPDLELWECGFPEWEGKVKIASKTLSVVTGIPGSGKTHFMFQIWFQIARAYGIRVAIMSAETGAKPHVRKFMRQFYHHKPQHELTLAQKDEADAWIDEHFVFIAHPNSRPTFEWVCDMIEVAVIRHGVRACVLDPWNKLETTFNPREKTETKWIGECLDNLLDMTRAFDMHIQVIAHPAKPDSKRRNEQIDLYCLNGSANWYNRMDQGFICHRPKLNNEDGSRCSEMVFEMAKTRFDELGWPGEFPMRLSAKTGCFKSSEFETKLEAGMDG
jgi:twinkle protein